MFGLGAIESMIGPYLKKIGASDHEIGVSFVIMGCMLLLGNFLVARVCKNDHLHLPTWVDFKNFGILDSL